MLFVPKLLRLLRMSFGCVLLFCSLFSVFPEMPCFVSVVTVASLFSVVTSVVMVCSFVLFLFFALPVASPPGGYDVAAYCTIIHLASGSGCFFVFPCLVFPCYSFFFSGYVFHLIDIFRSLSISFPFSPFVLCLSIFLSFNVAARFLACVCCTCRIQYDDGMPLHCSLLPVVVSRRNFATTELVSLYYSL